jgi:O-acetyl-ADP-ribose deacetylase (regulator of RNase III)
LEIRLVKEDIIKRDIEKILNCTNSWIEVIGGSTDDDIVKRGGSIVHRKTVKKRSILDGSALIAGKYYAMPNK